MEQHWCGDTEDILGMGLWGEEVRDGAALIWGHREHPGDGITGLRDGAGL